MLQKNESLLRKLWICSRPLKLELLGTVRPTNSQCLWLCIVCCPLPMQFMLRFINGQYRYHDHFPSISLVEALGVKIEFTYRIVMDFDLGALKTDPLPNTGHIINSHACQSTMGQNLQSLCGCAKLWPLVQSKLNPNFLLLFWYLCYYPHMARD